MKTLKQIGTMLIFTAFLAVLSIDTTFAGSTGVLLQFGAMIFLILLVTFLAKCTKFFDDFLNKVNSRSNES